MNFTKIDGRGQRKTTERRVFPLHGKRKEPIGDKLSRGDEGFWTVFGTVTLPAGASVAYRRGEGVIYRVFGTDTLPTGTSETSPRGKGGFWTVFGTATLPTGTSVASPRAKPVIYRPFGTATPPHRCLGGILGEPL